MVEMKLLIRRKEHGVLFLARRLFLPRHSTEQRSRDRDRLFQNESGRPVEEPVSFSVTPNPNFSTLCIHSLHPTVKYTTAGMVKRTSAMADLARERRDNKKPGKGAPVQVCKHARMHVYMHV